MPNQSDLDSLAHGDFVLKGRLSAPEFFCDGLTQITMTGSITKMLLHSTISPKSAESPEIRKALQLLSMQTVNAIELANFILKAAKDMEEGLLKQLNDEHAAKVKNILSHIQPGLPEHFERTSARLARKKK